MVFGGVEGGVSGRVLARAAGRREREVLEDIDFKVEVKESSSSSWLTRSPISDSALSVLIHERVRRNGVFLAT
jgi:hypothetical protein